MSTGPCPPPPPLRSMAPERWLVLHKGTPPPALPITPDNEFASVVYRDVDSLPSRHEWPGGGGPFWQPWCTPCVRRWLR